MEILNSATHRDDQQQQLQQQLHKNRVSSSETEQKNMFQVQEHTSSTKKKSTRFIPPTDKSRFLEHKRHALVASPAQSLKISTRALFSSTIKHIKQRFFRFPQNPSYPKQKKKTGERERR